MRGRGEGRDTGRRKEGKARNRVKVALKRLNKEVGQSQVRGEEMRGRGRKDVGRINVGRGGNGKRVGQKTIKKGGRGVVRLRGREGRGKGRREKKWWQRQGIGRGWP